MIAEKRIIRMHARTHTHTHTYARIHTHTHTHTHQHKYMYTVSSPASFSHLHQLGSQNQDLMEQNLILREQMTQFEQHTTDDGLRLQRRLMAELGLCFSELQSLVQVCLQRARGEDPNMSVLLGVTGQCQVGGGEVTGQCLRGMGVEGSQGCSRWSRSACSGHVERTPNISILLGITGQCGGGHRSVSKGDGGGGISRLQSLVQVCLQRACGEDPQHLHPAGGHRSVSVGGGGGGNKYFEAHQIDFICCGFYQLFSIWGSLGSLILSFQGFVSSSLWRQHRSSHPVNALSLFPQILSQTAVRRTRERRQRQGRRKGRQSSTGCPSWASCGVRWTACEPASATSMPRTWGRTSNVPLSDWRAHRVISHWSISGVFLSDWSSDCVISHWSVSGDYSLIGPVIVSSAIGPSAADYSVIGPQVMSLSHCSTDVLLGGCCTAMLHSDWPSHCSISVLPVALLCYTVIGPVIAPSVCFQVIGPFLCFSVIGLSVLSDCSTGTQVCCSVTGPPVWYWVLGPLQCLIVMAETAHRLVDSITTSDTTFTAKDSTFPVIQATHTHTSAQNRGCQISVTL